MPSPPAPSTLGRKEYFGASRKSCKCTVIFISCCLLVLGHLLVLERIKCLPLYFHFAKQDAENSILGNDMSMGGVDTLYRSQDTMKAHSCSIAAAVNIEKEKAGLTGVT